jgi:hypothetical protein
LGGAAAGFFLHGSDSNRFFNHKYVDAHNQERHQIDRCLLPEVFDILHFPPLSQTGA